jgi:hypothetical protein
VSFLARIPLYPLLLAAYAVLFVYAANISQVLPRDLVWPLTVALLGAAVVLAICGLVLRDIRRGALIAGALVLAFAFFGHLEAQLDVDLITEPMQMLLWLVFVVAVGVYALRAKGSLDTMTSVLNVFGIVLVAISLATIIPTETSRAVRATESPPVSGEPMTEATKVPNRDIYYLVFDRYGSDWSLEHSFGIKNDIYPDLEAAGFQVVPGARANYHTTDFSLAATLGMRYLDDIAATVQKPSTDRTPVDELLADHDVGKFLRANGYRYYHMGAWWQPTRTSPIADEVLALGSTTEFQSVLRDATILPATEGLLGLDHGDNHSRDQHREMALFELRQLSRLAATPGRKFVFAHVLLPHPPYVLAEGGRVVYKDEAKEKSESELLAQQLDFTNEQIRQLVAELLAGPDDEDPIIIISADEGPYLCYEVDCVDGSAEDYGIRFGVLRAYYLPDLDYQVPADDSGVNVFRMILREYFGADLPDLPNRSYEWVDRDTDMYTFRDVTDELPLPGGPGYTGD